MTNELYIQIARKDHQGPLARYVKIEGCACAGDAENGFPPPLVRDPDMHHGTCVTHVPRCMPGSLTIGFLWSRWRGKRSRHCRRMCNPQFYVSGKRPIAKQYTWCHIWYQWLIICLIKWWDVFQYRKSHLHIFAYSVDVASPVSRLH